MEFLQLPITESVAGGLLIGLGCALLWLSQGRIAGISGIFKSAFISKDIWRWGFLAGIVLGAFALHELTGIAKPAVPELSVFLVSAVFLVGFGASLANGCTSGHGVCGIGRLSYRSITAVLVFMAVAFAVGMVRHQLMGA